MPNIGDVLTNPAVGWSRYDITEKAINPGRHSYGSDSRCHNSSYLSLGVGSDSEVFFEFIGTKLIILTAMDPTFSKTVKVNIDGVESTFSSYITPTPKFKAVAFKIENLPNERHLVKISCTVPGPTPMGANSWIDAIDIDSSGILLPQLIRDYEFPVKIGNEEDVAPYAESLIGGEEQVLVTREGKLFLTDGNGSYKTVAKEDLTKYYTKDEVESLLSTIPADNIITDTNKDFVSLKEKQDLRDITTAPLGMEYGIECYYVRKVDNSNFICFDKNSLGEKLDCSIAKKIEVTGNGLDLNVYFKEEFSSPPISVAVAGCKMYSDQFSIGSPAQFQSKDRALLQISKAGVTLKWDSSDVSNDTEIQILVMFRRQVGDSRLSIADPNSHIHENKEVIDNFSDNLGVLEYKNAPIGKATYEDLFIGTIGDNGDYDINGKFTDYKLFILRFGMMNTAISNTSATSFVFEFGGTRNVVYVGSKEVRFERRSESRFSIQGVDNVAYALRGIVGIKF